VRKLKKSHLTETKELKATIQAGEKFEECQRKEIEALKAAAEIEKKARVSAIKMADAPKELRQENQRLVVENKGLRKNMEAARAETKGLRDSLVSSEAECCHLKGNIESRHREFQLKCQELTSARLKLEQADETGNHQRGLYNGARKEVELLKLQIETMELQEVGSTLRKEIDKLKEDLASEKKLRLEIMDSEKVAVELRKEIDQLKKDLTVEKSFHNRTKKEVEELKNDKLRVKPFLDIGVKVRRKNFENMYAKLVGHAADESIIKAGNAAAHHPNMAADAVLLQDCSVVKYEDRDAQMFKKIYLFPPDHYRYWSLSIYLQISGL